MHIAWLSLKNLRHLDDQAMDFSAGQGHLRKWNFLPMDRASAPALIEFIQVRHAPQERGVASPACRHLCWQVSNHGQSITACRPRAPVRDPSVLLASPPQGRSNRGWLQRLQEYAKHASSHTSTSSKSPPHCPMS